MLKLEWKKMEPTLHDVYLSLIEVQGTIQHAAELSLLCLKENNSTFVSVTAQGINDLNTSLRFLISSLEKVHNGN